MNVQVIAGGAFAIGVIALLDQGATEKVAQGFAWLFLVVAAYNAIPVISKTATGKAVKPAAKKRAA